MVNTGLLEHFKDGAWLVNTARGAICDKDAVAAAVKSGKLNGYSGDVWNVQPAPRDHPWRTVKNPLGGGNGMVPHYSGTTLDAQTRYANGVKQIVDNYLNGRAQDSANIIIGVGKYESSACEWIVSLCVWLGYSVLNSQHRWPTLNKSSNQNGRPHE